MNRKILIEEIAPGKIPGVEVEVFQPQNTGHDTYFEWTPCSLTVSYTHLPVSTCMVSAASKACSVER